MHRWQYLIIVLALLSSLSCTFVGFFPVRMYGFEKLYETACAHAKKSYESAFKPVESIETILTHGGHEPLSLPDIGNPVVAPITLSTTFQQLEPGTGKVCSVLILMTFLSMITRAREIVRGIHWRSA